MSKHTRYVSDFFFKIIYNKCEEDTSSLKTLSPPLPSPPGIGLKYKKQTQIEIGKTFKTLQMNLNP